MPRPPILLLPLVVLMSVLRLRPNFLTLYAGLAGAAVHLLLAARAMVVTGAAPDPPTRSTSRTGSSLR